MAKVFERIVYNQFYEYLNESNLISRNQSGFRSLRSTATALLVATDNWAFNIDKGNNDAIIFLDLKKAFDTVDHSLLLSKLRPMVLEATRLTGLSLTWIMVHRNAL